MKSIEHLFFDLDHTLWDYDKSAQETLGEVHRLLELSSEDISLKSFIDAFYQVNNQLWHLYNQGKIDRRYIKEQRFVEVLKKVDAQTESAGRASSYFLEHCSTKPYLIADTKAVLTYLAGRYKLHIITNGFTEAQNNKLCNSGIDSFFDVVVTSESTGDKKPSPGIFLHALEKAGTQASQSAMIGDNPRTDVQGAKEVGMYAVHYDPSGSCRSVADVRVNSLLELIKIF
ncbi:MAG: YjjG family noncanonical pyrimidine nucleotidase [Bacteroidota bacterium]